jgi:hypothetical protein
VAEPQHESGAPLWGVSAEFDTADAMLAALHALQPSGLGRLEAYSPVPIAGAAAALRLHRQPIYPFGLAGAAIGGVAMFAMCSYATIVSYRFNIGGRPLFSWPSFVVPSVSFAALTGCLAVVAAMFVFSRLPRLNHPAFNIPDFTRATEDRFFIAVEARDDSFDPARVEAALTALTMQPRRVSRVPR